MKGANTAGECCYSYALWVANSCDLCFYVWNSPEFRGK
jgi:hypothetical protein